MIYHTTITDSDLRGLIKTKSISFGGNLQLKIYGTLGCASGKRMKQKNRVFFASESDAVKNNFRPCGHCMKQEYKNWKNGSLQ